MNVNIDQKYKSILSESLYDLKYKTSLELNKLKGQALDSRRKELTEKEKRIEELQRLFYEL